MGELKFGERVNITKKYVRMTNYRHGKYNDMAKSWKATEFTKEGCIFLGKRALKNGWLDWNGHSYDFIQTGTVKAYLVCADERTKPFYVPLDGINKG